MKDEKIEGVIVPQPNLNEDVIIERHRSYIIIRINRPKTNNLINTDMYKRLCLGLETAIDTDAWGAIITGTDNVFTYGNDLGDFMSCNLAAADHPLTRFIELLTHFPKILIAAVNGLASGIGTTMLLHCDFVLASPDASFETPYVDFGLVPENASTMLLEKRIGLLEARKMLLLSLQKDAQEMQELGLVSWIFDNPLEKARELAKELAILPRQALLETTKLLKREQESITKRVQAENSAFIERLRTPEALHAISQRLKGSH
jgi:enoyl-CoA hydratase/carnithine racemase